MTEHRISPLQWLSTKFASLNHTHEGKEDKSNKVTSLSSSSTDTEYPSAKIVKDSLDSKLDKTHTSYKGKNVVTNSSTGAIEFEEKNNHTHSQYLTSHQDISGKIDTAGTGLSKSGTTINHSNSITAQTTNALKKIKYDSQGHITDSADVTASDLPTHTHSQYLTEHQSLDSKTVTVEKQSTAESGYAHTYVVKQNNSQVGVKINIPKDFLVKSATVKTVTTANNPVSGYVIGDKYLDFVVNSKDNSATDEHLYVLVSDLVDTEIEWNNIQNKPTLFSGSYADLTNKPSYTPTITSSTNGAYKIGSINISGSNVDIYGKDTDTHQDISVKEDKSNKTSSWNSTTNNTRYPTEKLVKDSLDEKANLSHNHNDTYYTETEIDSLLEDKLDVSNAFTGSYDDLTDKPNSFTPSSHSHNISEVTNLQNSLNNKLESTDVGAVALSNDYDDLDNKPTIPTATSDLTNDSNFITSSSLNDYVNKTDISLDSDFLENFLQSLIDYGIENDKEWINL